MMITHVNGKYLKHYYYSGNSNYHCNYNYNDNYNFKCKHCFKQNNFPLIRVSNTVVCWFVCMCNLIQFSLSLIYNRKKHAYTHNHTQENNNKNRFYLISLQTKTVCHKKNLLYAVSLFLSLALVPTLALNYIVVVLFWFSVLCFSCYCGFTVLWLLLYVCCFFFFFRRLSNNEMLIFSSLVECRQLAHDYGNDNDIMI